jgi:dTDP-4-dehydrorhamnose reductase
VTAAARVLVTGAGGQLGRALCARLGRRVVRAADRSDLDLRDSAALERAVRECEADVVMNAAAYNDVDGAERQPELAFAVNAQGPARLALACQETGATLVHVSTDYVFDGRQTRPYTEDDEPRPLGVYGASKLAGEQAVLGSRARSLVLRTSGVFGDGGSRVKGGSFVERILARARAGEPLRVVCDQVFSPTYAPDLAGALLALLERGARGLVHVTNSGACSWHGLAEAALRLAGREVPLTAIRAEQLGRPAVRPAYSVLSNERYRSFGLEPLRPWQDALAELLRP